MAHGINDLGWIVGRFGDAMGDHGFLTSDGTTFTTIDVPGATRTDAYAINSAGQIVGLFGDATGSHGFLTSDGTTFTIIDAPNAMATDPHGINDRGQIVGTVLDATGNHGFVATPVAVDASPPAITVSASPATLRPPNGQLVAVTVSGAITDKGSGVSSAAYQVIDEYGQIQPSGIITLGAGGRYTFTVGLQASRNGNDQDGRRHTIEVSATDHAGNEGTKSATVTVPRK